MVSALGYFVDVYDLYLFTVYRVSSLKDIGIPAAQGLNAGANLLNLQTGGMVIGGIVWGSLGDKRGRRSVLFGSILIYSLANVANAFVHDVGFYAVCRFWAGIGLAGELGAALTLISELIRRDKRSYGSAIIFGVGLLGAVSAAFTAKHVSWRIGYLTGGAMGVALLALRAGLLDSAMFDAMKKRECRRGSLGMLLQQQGRWKRYAYAVLAGIPTWFGGILVTFLPEFSKLLGVVGDITVADGILFAQSGQFVGSLASCLVSQWLRSRRKSDVWLLVGLHLCKSRLSDGTRSLGGAGKDAVPDEWIRRGLQRRRRAGGRWKLFGTNLRSTVATTIPNFVRASSISMLLAFPGPQRDRWDWQPTVCFSA